MARVLVVGAGSTGLTAALELKRRGAEVMIVDKKEVPSTLSRAVGIIPKTLHLLGSSGVSAALLAEGIKIRHFFIYNSGTLAFEISSEAVKREYNFSLCLPQDRTESILRDALKEIGVDVEYGVSFESLEDCGDKVVAHLMCNQDAREETFDYVLGCDGVHSVVRTCLGLEYSGHDLEGLWSIADVNIKNWKHADSMAMFLGEKDMCISIPIAKDRYRIVATKKDALKAVPLKMDIETVNREAEFHISVRQVPHYNVGRVFLAGDAAHCHSPVGGRGMNLGMADACIFAQYLQEGSLDQYSQARHQEGHFVIDFSEKMRKTLMGRSFCAKTKRFFLMRTLCRSRAAREKFIERFLGPES